MDIKCRMMSIWQKPVAVIAETKNLKPCTRAKDIERVTNTVDHAIRGKYLCGGYMWTFSCNSPLKKTFLTSS